LCSVAENLRRYTVVAMANKAPYQTTFDPEYTIQPIFTGGSIGLDQTGRILATTLGEDALLTDMNTGRQLAKIEGVCLSRH
jgi:U3 small nucleolar RNA-associated protein 13